MLHKVYLGLGTNLGKREENLKNALLEIEGNIGKISKKSRIYETTAWGKTDQNSFLNQVILLETALKPLKLLEKTQKIEQKLGRIKTEHWGERSIDIDILFYDNLILETENLTIPHKYIQARNFVLMPLQEIAPEFVHPILQENISVLVKKTSDTSACNIYL